MTQRTVGRQTVILGDCVEEMRAMERESVDVVITSPPYNIGVKYATHGDALDPADYAHWMHSVAGQLRRVLRTDGSLFLNLGGTGRNPWVVHDVAAQFRKFFVLQNDVAWVKSITVDGTTRGHFKPVNSRRFLNNCHETVLHLTRSGNVELDRLAVGVPFTGKSNVARFGHARDLRCGGNVWFIPYDTVRSKSEKHDHPAAFPVALAERCIRLHGATRRTVVLDPFLGSGTTLVAAANLGCRGIGVELDPQYARAAIARLRKPPSDNLQSGTRRGSARGPR